MEATIKILATKDDIASVRDDLSNAVLKLRDDIGDLKYGLRKDIAEAKTETIK